MKQKEPWVKIGQKETGGLVGATLLMVFAGGFAITDTVLEAVSPDRSDNLLISAGVGAATTAVLGGLSYASGILKI